MSRPTKPRVNTAAYPPRGMRAERAAAYLDVSESTFLRLVEDKELPPGIAVRGMVLWDRCELDSAFDNWKAKQRKIKRNTFDELLDRNG
jgi:predicted DNA-binding transcriptional regulator AlpA